MCDTLCRLAQGRTLFAKNSDRPVGERQLVEAHPARTGGGELRASHIVIPDEGAFATVGSRPEWCWGFEHGVNEHRVAIGNEKVWTVDDPHAAAPGLIGMDLVRLGLERARTADDALTVMTGLLDRHGQGGDCELDGDPYWSSFLVADPEGAWILETSGSTWAARPVDGGAAISNRISLSTDWQRASADLSAGADFDEWRDPEVPTAIGDLRLAVTRPVAAVVDDPRHLTATLRDHGREQWGRVGDPGFVPPPPELAADFTGITVCMHLRDSQATAASMIAVLSRDRREPLRAWVTTGSPCVAVYVPVFPPAWVPPELADPSTWDRFERLRMRVEEHPDELETVREVLGPIEADLWADADDVARALAAGGGSDAVRAFMGATGPRLDLALLSLGV